MARHGWAVIAIVAIVSAASITAGLWTYRIIDAAADDRPEVPGFSLPDRTGIRHGPAEWRGKVLILNFWATWCPPCRREIPELIGIQKEHAGRGLQIVGIAVEAADPVEAFATTVDFNYPVLIGGEAAMALSSQMGNRLGILPFTAVVDRNGRIVHTHTGPLTGERLGALVDPLLNDKP